MSLRKHKVFRRQSDSLPFSGSIIESDPTPTGSLLAQNTAVPSDSGSHAGIPLVSTSLTENTSTTAAQSSSTPTATATSSTPSGSQISLGTVIGACTAAALALFLALLLAYYCSKRQKQLAAASSKSRNTLNNVSRRRSHLEAWKRIDDDHGDQTQQRERPMRQRPPSGPIGTMFQRSLSNSSAEKSSDGHHRESVGTMQHFAKYHPGLAAEMASQNDAKAMDGDLAKPPPIHHLVGRGSGTTGPLSWDGDTVVTGQSFMSLHSSASQSPVMMATAKATPPATASSPHHWESAEVVHVGSNLANGVELQNPFDDTTSSVRTVRTRSSTRGQNPFFSGRDHPIRRPVLPDTHTNPFADLPSSHDSSAAAIKSLIAALEDNMGQDDRDRIVSVQSSVYSRATADDSESAVSVTAFPYPPTQINLH